MVKPDIRVTLSGIVEKADGSKQVQYTVTYEDGSGTVGGTVGLGGSIDIFASSAARRYTVRSRWPEEEG